MHQHSRGTRRPARLLTAVLCLLAGLLSGCAAITNPVADAVPVRLLPQEVLGRRRETDRTIPLPWLRLRPPEEYRLAPGDVLGVWVEGVFSAPDQFQPPPVRLPETGVVPPAIGYPIPVREDGTVPLPMIAPVRVAGLTLAEAEQAIIRAYTVQTQILRKGRERVIVTLIRPRVHQVLVIRQDTGGIGLGASGLITQVKRGAGFAVDLPAYQNDVLHALAQTGGLPGLDAANEVIIQRGYFRSPGDRDLLLQQLEKDPTCLQPPGAGADTAGIQSVRIPLRLPPHAPPPFQPEDIILQTGDIVFIEARDTELFYTGGLLPPRQFILPRDYDLNVVEAVLLASGPLVNGGFAGSNLSGQLIGTGASGLGFPSPSLLIVLRRAVGGGQIPIRVDLTRALRDPRERILVQPGDILILQETIAEAVGRYVTTNIRFNFLGTLIRRRDFTATVSGNLP